MIPDLHAVHFAYSTHLLCLLSRVIPANMEAESVTGTWMQRVIRRNT